MKTNDRDKKNKLKKDIKIILIKKDIPIKSFACRVSEIDKRHYSYSYIARILSTRTDHYISVEKLQRLLTIVRAM